MCMDFLVNPAEDGTVMSGRTVEFGTDMQTKGIIRRAGSTFQSPAPGDDITNDTLTCNGAQWTSKYSYIGTANGNSSDFSDMMTILSVGMKFVLQGMNTEGLSCGALYLSESKYPTTATDNLTALHYLCFADWVMGNCASVREVVEKLQQKKVVIWGDKDTQGSFGVHYSLFDKTGTAIVVEWIDGEINIYNNPLRVCTNEPTFDWHLKNVQNYLNLSKDWPKKLHISNKFSQSATTKNEADSDLPNLKTVAMGAATGSGYGMRGLPGDASPPSRLIRMFFLKNCASRAADASELRNQVLHLINSTDIIKGDNWSELSKKELPSTDYTQLSMILDYTHLTVYFRTYDQPELRRINLLTALKENSADLLEFSYGTEDTVAESQIFPTVAHVPPVCASMPHAAE